VAGEALGQGNTAQGYQYGVGVLCAIAVVMFLCCFFWVRERVSLDMMGNLPCASISPAA
jgi:Na+/melibiose symporter-like transporter